MSARRPKVEDVARCGQRVIRGGEGVAKLRRGRRTCGNSLRRRSLKGEERRSGEAGERLESEMNLFVASVFMSAENEIGVPRLMDRRAKIFQMLQE